MSDWKYIMFEANGALVPVIFPNRVIHKQMERGAGHAIREMVIAEKPNNWSSKVLSAGFVSGLAVTGVHGMSESMGNIKSIETDASIMNRMPYEHGADSILGPGIESMLLLKTIEHLMDRIKELSP